MVAPIRYGVVGTGMMGVEHLRNLLITPGAEVVAVEREPTRLRRLHDNLARLRLQVEVVQADAAETRESTHEPA